MWMSKCSATTIALPKNRNDADRFELMLANVANRRITYKELTGKVGETTPF
jgi:hypothetical protein